MRSLLTSELHDLYLAIRAGVSRTEDDEDPLRHDWRETHIVRRTTRRKDGF